MTMRSKIFLYSSNAGWPNGWTDFDRAGSGWVDPSVPGSKADPRYYFAMLGDRAKQMQVDGIIFTLTHVGTDTYRLAGRMDAMRAGSGTADRAKILMGLLLLKQKFNKPIWYYAGCPDFSDPGLLDDRKYLDGYLSSSLGPYLDTGMIDGVVFDSMSRIIEGGDVQHVCAAVLNACARLWPKLQWGGEPNMWQPYNQADLAGMTCSLTTQQAVEGGALARFRCQLSDTFSPQFVVEVRPHKFTQNDFDVAASHLRDGRCVAILPWQVGYAPEYSGPGTQPYQPSDSDAEAWNAFLSTMSTAQDQGGTTPSTASPPGATS